MKCGDVVKFKRKWWDDGGLTHRIVQLDYSTAGYIVACRPNIQWLRSHCRPTRGGATCLACVAAP